MAPRRRSSDQHYKGPSFPPPTRHSSRQGSRILKKTQHPQRTTRSRRKPRRSTTPPGPTPTVHQDPALSQVKDGQTGPNKSVGLEINGSIDIEKAGIISYAQSNPAKPEHIVLPSAKLGNTTLEPSRSQEQHNTTPPATGDDLDADHTKSQLEKDTTAYISAPQRELIGGWAESSDWPKEYFKRYPMDPLGELYAINPSLKRSASSVPTLATPSDKKPREEKARPYASAIYELTLSRLARSHTQDHPNGIREECKEIISVLYDYQDHPRHTFFCDVNTMTHCMKLANRNEARISKDLLPLLVPSAETFASLGAKHLEHVVESVNEGWNECWPITEPRPQPDYSVGFGLSAFSDDQIARLDPFLGQPGQLSLFMATSYMYFPFLTCEVKSSFGVQVHGERQNLHSMTVALKGVVELFKAVGRQEELHRRILGFSFVHNHNSITIYAHYPTFEGDKVDFWRQKVDLIDFTLRSGKNRWVSYTFVKNIYDTWVTPHLQLISSAVDQLPLKPKSVVEGDDLQFLG